MSRIPICVFTIDDALLSDYTIAYDEFRKRGLLGTSYIIGNKPGVSTGNDQVSWLHLQCMQRNGWDMQCHTFTHTDITTLTSQQLHDEMINTENAMSQNGLGIPQHHAFPFGANNQASKDIVLSHRLTVREIGVQNWNTYEQIKTRTIRATETDIKDEATFTIAKNALDAAYSNNGIIVYFFHFVEDELKNRGQYSITKSYLQQLLDYVIAKKIRVMTIAEMYNHVLTN